MFVFDDINAIYIDNVRHRIVRGRGALINGLGQSPKFRPTYPDCLSFYVDSPTSPDVPVACHTVRRSGLSGLFGGAYGAIFTGGHRYSLKPQQAEAEQNHPFPNESRETNDTDEKDRLD